MTADIIVKTRQRARRAGFERMSAKCVHCGERYSVKQVRQRFCTPTCNRAFYSKAQSRCIEVYEPLLNWRKTRGRGKDLSVIASIVDAWISEDAKRKAEKGSADEVA